MMLARVADSLYWIGRYVERAEHMCRLCDVMLNATLEPDDAAAEVAHIALASAGAPAVGGMGAYEAALSLALDRHAPGSIASALSRARENARQVRDQITTETWERLNLIFLRITDPEAPRAFANGSSAFLHEIIADLHLFKGAADATMSHGEGWRFLLLGTHLERAQLIARLLEVCFGSHQDRISHDHLMLTSLLRMSCALEPYLRAHTSDLQAAYILRFLLLDEDFPRSVRFCTARIEEHVSALGRPAAPGHASPERLAGRLRARLQYADLDEVQASGPAEFVLQISEACAGIHTALHETFVAYPVELRLPA